MIQVAKARGIRQVMINTNGVRPARDDRFLAQMAALNPVVYFQFDGLRAGGFIRRGTGPAGGTAGETGNLGEFWGH